MTLPEGHSSINDLLTRDDDAKVDPPLPDALELNPPIVG
jgi:hypothetical protein